MKPTMTIIGYLYSGRNTWLRHDDGCKCPPSEIIKRSADCDNLYKKESAEN